MMMKRPSFEKTSSSEEEYVPNSYPLSSREPEPTPPRLNDAYDITPAISERKRSGITESDCKYVFSGKKVSIPKTMKRSTASSDSRN